MADDFAARYAGLLTGSYDCVDRIVLNAYYPMGNTAGGFRTWWRRLIGGPDAEADAVLDNTHLMRLAGRFARRVRAWAVGNTVPVIDCKAGERKHLIAEEYLRTHSVGLNLWVPKSSSTSRDQAIFVDRATDASLSSYAVLPENDRLW